MSKTWGFETLSEGGSPRWLADYQRILVNAFVEIEFVGFPFNPVTHQDFISRLNKVHEEYDEKLRTHPDFVAYCKHADLDPEDFKFTSPTQLQKFLFSPKVDKGLSLKPLKVSDKTGKPSTDKESLKSFAKQGVDFAEILLTQRNFSKLMSSFGEPLLKLYNKYSGAIHPTYFLAKVIESSGQEAGTATGRLSCKLPNLQQLPKRDKDASNVGLAGIDVRASFEPFPGHVLAELDHSQLEVRVAGIYAKDQQMAKFFEMGGDFHSRVASMVTGYDYDLIVKAKDEVNHPRHEEMSKIRATAKSITFGLLYGMGLNKLVRESGLTEQEGNDFINTYFSIFPELAAWREYMIEKAQRTGKVTTLFGRVRRLKMSGFNTEDGRETRIGINTPIQSCGADITLYGLARIWEKLFLEGYESRVIATIHDSIVLSVAEKEFYDVMSWVPDYMRQPPGLEWLLDNTPVKLDVGIDLGPNFRDMVEVKEEDLSSLDISSYICRSVP